MGPARLSFRSNFFFSWFNRTSYNDKTPCISLEYFIHIPISIAMGPMSKKRKLTKVEEVNFDADARHEFLTGFRKRKQQRIKHAQEAAEKRAREEKRQDRKMVRHHVL